MITGRAARLWPVLAAVLISTASWIFVNPSGDFPLNDEWSYAPAAGRLAGEGVLTLCQHASVPDLPPILLGAALSRIAGFSHTLLRFSTQLWALLGVFFLYGILKDAGLPESSRLLACICLCFNPLYAYLSFTFHSDVPCAALLMGAIRFFLKAETPGEERWLWLSSLLGSLCALTRQTGMVFFLGAGLWYLSQRRFDPRLWTRLFLVPALAGGVFLFWYLKIHGVTWAPVGILARELREESTHPLVQFGHAMVWLADGVIYAAFFSAPLLMSSENGKSWRWRAAGAAFAALWALLRGPMPYLQNVLHQTGLGPLTGWGAEHKPLSMWSSPWLWWGAAALAGAAFWRTARLFLTSRPFRGADWLPLLLVCPPAFVLLSREIFFDRYVLGLLAGWLPWIALRAARNRPPAAAWGLAALMAFASLVGIRDYFAWNRAKWALGEKAIALGFSPEEVSNGIDWAAHHYYESRMAALEAQKPLREIGEMEWKKVGFPKVFVTLDPALYPLDHLLAVQRYSSPLTRGPAAFFLFRSGA